jgi:hypothetical protein
LDRFSRNRYDSAHYKHQLKRYGIVLRSVIENIDGSPESVIMESVLESVACQGLFSNKYSKALWKSGNPDISRDFTFGQ